MEKNITVWFNSPQVKILPRSHMPWGKRESYHVYVAKNSSEGVQVSFMAPEAGGVSSMFYGWEPLRDIASPGTLKFSTYINAYSSESVDTLLTDEAIKNISERIPDFVFLYMVDTDEKGGHDNGWMSEEYLRRISIAIDNVKRVIERFGEEYTVIIMADHGGHDRSHGTDMPEDMMVPLFMRGSRFKGGAVLEDASLLDIAPTIADVMGVFPDGDWDGRSFASQNA